MEAFAIRLNNIKDTYYDFVIAVLTYVKKKESRLKAVESFMNENPNALTSDILEFISDQDDFYEDAAPARSEATGFPKVKGISYAGTAFTSNI